MSADISSTEAGMRAAGLQQWQTGPVVSSQRINTTTNGVKARRHRWTHTHSQCQQPARGTVWLTGGFQLHLPVWLCHDWTACLLCSKTSKVTQTRQHFKTSQATLHRFVRHAVAAYVEHCKSATFLGCICVRVLFFKVVANVDSEMAHLGFEQSSQNLANRLQTCISL